MFVLASVLRHMWIILFLHVCTYTTFIRLLYNILQSKINDKFLKWNEYSSLSSLNKHILVPTIHSHLFTYFVSILPHVELCHQAAYVYANKFLVKRMYDDGRPLVNEKTTLLILWHIFISIYPTNLQFHKCLLTSLAPYYIISKKKFFFA